jgi:FKBP-type peptidyl-prolyl cis-trans isomerase 2
VLEEDRLALDFNHPLAGQPVTLFVRVNTVSLLQSAREEVDA